MDKGLTWVLARLRIEASRPIVLGEVLTVETWPSGVERLFALRDFRVLDAEGAEVARATSQWLVLSLDTRRALWPDDVLVAEAREAATKVFPTGFIKHPPLGAPVDEERRFDTRYQDVDRNAHVTSTSYVRWALEAIPIEVWKSSWLSFLEIHYLGEAMHPGSIVSKSRRIAEVASDARDPGSAPSVTFVHAIAPELGEPDKAKDHARVTTRWLPRNGGF